jgi:hypothetical protein
MQAYNRKISALVQFVKHPGNYFACFFHKHRLTDFLIKQHSDIARHDTSVINCQWLIEGRDFDVFSIAVINADG